MLAHKAFVGSCAFVLRWIYCISRPYQVKYQAQWKWPNRYSQRLRRLPLSLHAQADTQAALAQYHRSPTAYRYGVFVFLFLLFKYSLISIHSVENHWTRTAVVVIPNTLWWNAPTFYHVWCRTNAALMMTFISNPLFSSNCTTWLIDVHPTWWKENILEVLHIVQFDL